MVVLLQNISKDPVRLLAKNFILKADKEESSTGTVPESWLSDSKRNCTLVNNPIPDGIVLLNELAYMDRPSKFLSAPAPGPPTSGFCWL
jgi:hypothetical protein